MNLENERIAQAFNKSTALNGVKPTGSAKTSDLSTITNAAFLWAGIVCVAVIIISGLYYILASGDPGKIATAKNSLMYALVGLVVVILASAIVNFVLGVI